MRLVDWNELLDSCYSFRDPLPNHNKQRHGKSCSPIELWLMLQLQEELRSRSQLVTVGDLNGILEEICGRWEFWNTDVTGKKRRRGVFLLPSHPSALHSQQCRFSSAGTVLINTLKYTINLLFPVPITCLNHINTMMRDMIRMRRNRRSFW